jgi:hypothetical protein
VEKAVSPGIAIISRIEVIIGTIGLFIFVPLSIFEWLGELNRVHVGNEDYVGFGVNLILGIVSGMTFIAGKFIYRLNPLGRILNLILAYGLVILYILLFFITVRLIGFYPYFKNALFDSSFIIIFVISFLWLLFLIYFFNCQQVKEQFRKYK